MIEFLHEHGGQLMSKTLEHFYISIVALLLAIIVAVPIGILLWQCVNRKMRIS